MNTYEVLVVEIFSVLFINWMTRIVTQWDLFYFPMIKMIRAFYFALEHLSKKST